MLENETQSPSLDRPLCLHEYFPKLLTHLPLPTIFLGMFASHVANYLFSFPRVLVFLELDSWEIMTWLKDYLLCLAFFPLSSRGDRLVLQDLERIQNNRALGFQSSTL